MPLRMKIWKKQVFGLIVDEDTRVLLPWSRNPPARSTKPVKITSQSNRPPSLVLDPLFHVY